MSEDRRLLREYVETGSRQALHELIQRHLGLVYSAALRQVRDPNLAEDVTQAVFLVLTQKARTIRNGVAVGGWLLTVTRYVVVTVMRKQAIKNKHEQLAARPEAMETVAQDWEEIAPLLDAELNRLGHVDRDAVVLRFFQDRSFAEIGEELGFSEEAARKRVGRALERLRARLDGRGQSISTGALAVALGAFALGTVPKHVMAGTIAASVGSPTPHCISLAKGAIKMIAWTKAKLVGALAASVLMGGTGAAVVTQSFAQQAGAVIVVPIPAASATPAPTMATPTVVAPAPVVAEKKQIVAGSGEAAAITTEPKAADAPTAPPAGAVGVFRAAPPKPQSATPAAGAGTVMLQTQQGGAAFQLQTTTGEMVQERAVVPVAPPSSASRGDSTAGK